MFSRMIAIVISSWLAVSGVILPMSPFYRANAIVVGVLAAVLSGFALVDDRARFGTALLGAWTAFAAVFGGATVLDLVVSVCWGVTTFTALLSPFSSPPQVTWQRPTSAPVPVPERPVETRLAA
ncbi:MAG TPA: hypothetical protein VHJ20_10970 [Polyangia bacterium]|nr:hypothetical protein [Polyangia bacterium]